MAPLHLMPQRLPKEKLSEAPAEGLWPATGRVRPLSPQVPLFLNGDVVEDLERLNAEMTEPLHVTCLVNGDSLVLAAFTDRQAMLSEVRRTYADSAQMAVLSGEHYCVSHPEALPDYVRVWEDANESGDYLDLDAGYYYPDLSKVHRGFLHTQNWNDIISSLSACRYDVALFEDTGLTGHEFFAPKGCNTPDLSALGFNDITSSLINFGG
ncbi:hypothetical protein MUU72_00985 [Streptomyces sp. RS10V-4]|uniref:hypothetical protein n=1 Tax=Streptomyces rhizoryzae TaxID=2932493 RepID=UPI00200311D4|nr:hypothetical protein [Streptomyces rhizoryzae]MCK7621716.1 hypothetical protein [Streptomyces rhizoryzae]